MADILEYQPEGLYDLVAMCYVHLPANERAKMLSTASAALAPGGTLLFIGIAPSDDPDYAAHQHLFAAPEEVVAGLPGLAIERAEAIHRTIPYPGGVYKGEGVIVQARRGRRRRALGLVDHLVRCLCLVMLVSCQVPNEPDSVAFEFMYALVAADIDRARSATVPEQWDALGELMNERQPFKCRPDELFDLSGANGYGTFDDIENEWRWVLSYECVSSHTPYCVSLKDVLIRQTDDGWRVYDWGEPCEYADYHEVCDWYCH